MSDINHIIGLSGGKDSTALALRLIEVEPRDYTFLITPTGDELPEMIDHWLKLEQLLGKPLTRITNRNLGFWIDEFNALPNFRQRWCTRLLKIEPTIAYIKTHQPAVLYVGLRADEPLRQGIYSEEVESRFPLREWGWTESMVWNYLREKGVTIPERTDCARCYAQRISQWKRLWSKHPAIFAEAEADELRTGKTFRTPNKGDGWPTSLREIREEFERGRLAPGEKDPRLMSLFDDDLEMACRVCSL